MPKVPASKTPAPILPGAEPFSREGGPGGVLVLHGFTGSPQSMRPLATALAEAGLSVELPLLPGHGTSLDDMAGTRWEDYAAAAEAALSGLLRRCDAVAVAGLSMGGTLACWLSEQHAEISGLALVNPFVDPPAESFRDVLRGLLDAGDEFAPGVGSDIAKEGSVELAYDRLPVASALSLFDAIDEVAAELPKIACPVLLMSSREDHVVPPSSGDVLVAGVTGPCERIWLERSYHVATLDHDAPEIETRIVDFASRLLDSTAAGSGAPGRRDRRPR